MESIFAKQRAKSNYQSIKDSKEAVHKLLHTKELHLKPPLRKALEYLWNCKGGITKASFETISKDLTKKMGKGYGLRTIKEGFKLAKEKGLIMVEEDSDRSKDGHKLCALKILAPIETIVKFIQENTQRTDELGIGVLDEIGNFALEVAPKIALEVAPEVAPRENPSIHCGSKDEGDKIETNKSLLSFIKQDKTLKDNKDMYQFAHFDQFISGWKKFEKYWNSPEEKKKAVSAIKRGIKKSGVKVDFAEMGWQLQLIIGMTVSYYRKGEFNDERHFLNHLAYKIQKKLNPNPISKPVQPKKPIRTELRQSWEDEFEKEQEEADRKKAEEKAENQKSVEEQKAEIDALLSSFRTPQSQEQLEQLV